MNFSILFRFYRDRGQQLSLHFENYFIRFTHRTNICTLLIVWSRVRRAVDKHQRVLPASRTAQGNALIKYISLYTQTGMQPRLNNVIDTPSWEQALSGYGQAQVLSNWVQHDELVGSAILKNG